MRALAAALVVLALALPAFAVNPDEMLADPGLEARARVVSSELRCLVCQNQSIEDSDADLARELRLIVRERIAAGDTDAEAKQFIVDRYGEFVLLRPVFALHTLILWIAAPLLLLAGLAAIGWAAVRRRRTDGPAAVPPTAEEQAILDRLEGRPRHENDRSVTES